MEQPSRHLFVQIDQRYRKKAVWLLGLATAMLLWAESAVDGPLRTAWAPNGIISFELAKSFTVAQKIMASWNPNAKLYAAFSLGLDYLFLVAYSLFLALAVFSVAKIFKERSKGFFRIGLLLAWLQFLAAVFDALENGFLIRLLFGAQNSWFSLFAFYCATLKFLFVLSGIVYIFSGLTAYAFMRRRNP